VRKVAQRMPREPFAHYLQHRLFYDCAGWSGPDQAAERGSEWVRAGLAELPPTQVVFATDYPQAVRHVDEIVAYVKAVGGLGSGARKILDGANAEKLIPNLKERLTRVQLNAGNGFSSWQGNRARQSRPPLMKASQSCCSSNRYSPRRTPRINRLRLRMKKSPATVKGGAKGSMFSAI
jgi:hypothetical protein